jgi:hypothetical protein
LSNGSSTTTTTTSTLNYDEALLKFERYCFSNLLLLHKDSPNLLGFFSSLFNINSINQQIVHYPIQRKKIMNIFVGSLD